MCSTRVALLVFAAALIACNEPRPARSDAPIDVVIDASVDAAIEAQVDAQVDAAIDAFAPDAPSSSPSCAGGATTLLDVTPKQLASIKRAGDVLYASAYLYDSMTVSAPVVYAVDLMTGQTIGMPHATNAAVALYASGDAVYGPEYIENGTIWRFRPGMAPEALVTQRPYPGPVAADESYVYWVEATSGANDAVKRRLIAGGPIENIMTCTDVYELLLDGASLYCVGFTGITWGLKAGGSIPQGISMPSTYPIFTALIDSGVLYYVDFGVYPELYAVNLFGSSAALVKREPEIGRCNGLETSRDYYYTVDVSRGIRRIHRGDLTTELIVPSFIVAGDPVLWNDQLYYMQGNVEAAGLYSVQHCAN